MKRPGLLVPIVLSVVALLAIACSDDKGVDAGGFLATASESLSVDEVADFQFEQVEAQAESESASVVPASVSTPTTPSTSAVTGASDQSGSGERSDPALQIQERRVIQNASLTVQVDDVRQSAIAVRDVALVLGGFVEELSVSGDGESASGFVVLRVPQEEFFRAQDRIRVLGKVIEESVGTLDVTEQFVDQEARLRGLVLEEGRLLDLLGRVATISEILVLEGELTRIRTEIERLQGQLNFLERRVTLATISVSLFPPQPVRTVLTDPPSATFTVSVDNVEQSADAVKDLALQLEGVVDRASLRIDDGRETGTVVIRVPRDAFDDAVAVVQGLGEVRQKTLNEGPGEGVFSSDSIVITDPEEPDARIDVRLFETVVVIEVDDDSDDTVWIAAIAAVSSFAFAMMLTGLMLTLRRRRTTDGSVTG